MYVVLANAGVNGDGIEPNSIIVSRYLCIILSWRILCSCVNIKSVLLFLEADIIFSQEGETVCMAFWRTNTYISLTRIIFYIQYNSINIPCTGNGSGTVSSQTSSWARLVLSSPAVCASFRALCVSMTTVGPWNSQKWQSPTKLAIVGRNFAPPQPPDWWALVLVSAS